MEKRRQLSALAAAAGMLILILDSRTAVSGAAEGAALCLKTVIPSLFPFIFLSGVFSGNCTGTGRFVRVLGKFFGVPKNLEYLLVPALLGGYPVGAQCVYETYRRGTADRPTAERLLAYCSNAGPAFLFGILPGYFGGSQKVFLIWGIQLCSIAGAAYLFSPKAAQVSAHNAYKKPFGMEQAIAAMLKICGWVVLFRVMAAFLNRWCLWLLSPGLQTAVTGLMELVGGCCMLEQIADEGVRFCLCNILLAFGGICVAYQTASVCPGLKMRWYLLGKLTQAAGAGFLAAVLYNRLWYLLPIWPTALRFVKNIEKRVEISSSRVYNGCKKGWGAVYAVSEEN